MTTTEVDTRTVPVTLLRAGAAVLGVYGYVVGLWLDRRGLNPEPVATIREWVNRPLGLGEDFGPFAVMLLLACTGYTAAATGFEVRRLVSVCLPLLVAAACAAAVVLAGLDTWTMRAGTPLVPLAWVVGLQLVGWLVALDRWAWPSTLVLLAGTGVLCRFAADVPQLGVPLEFLPLVLVGHLTWRVLDRTLPALAGVLLGAGCFAAIIGVDRTFTDLQPWWYPVAATLAVLVFLVAVRVPGPTAATVAAQPVIRWLAGAAEWLILVGGVVGFAVIGLVVDS